MKRSFEKYASILLILVTALIFGGCTELLLPVQESTQAPLTQTLTRAAQTKAAQTRTLTRTTQTKPAATAAQGQGLGAIQVRENGRYTSKMDVAAYLYQYGELPSNYLTKAKAREMGWDAQKGNLWQVTDKMSIGGDRFGNFEGLLPEKPGRQYYECDIGYKGGSRGAKRIVFSNDGLIFYTDDHYESFERLN